ncbi:MAG TPA: hypothetical protein VG125_16800 [Pirellulales bacterium]|nr:hypothetical protein [Pirellulales bacterium]
MTGLVGLHLHRSSDVVEISERPCASPLARLQATEGPSVTTLRHRRLVLSELDRQVLLRLDGRQNHGELVQAVAALVKSGQIDLEGSLADEPDPSAEVISRVLTKSLRRLARGGLLAG